ncbi:MAG: DUF86 domain-containing protein [Bacteroidetes bacterium]|nr:DUF86 domain-containing protein [Bacteroidota bacterium]
MSFEPHDYLRHIHLETAFLQSSCANINFDSFVTDEVLQRAVVRSLEIIGEASKKIPDSFRNEHPEIDWRAMSGMRDRLIHAYFGVDYELVWDVVLHRIPALRKQIAFILGSR